MHKDEISEKFKFPLAQTGAVMLNLASPAHKVADRGRCTLMSTGHVSMLTNPENLPKVKAAEDAMANAEALCSTRGLDPEKAALALGMHKCRLIAFICKRGADFEGQDFASMEDINQANHRILV